MRTPHRGERMVQLTAAMAAFLALVHILSGRGGPARTAGRPTWLSLAGGASVAYVFIFILPNLCAGQSLIQNLNTPLVGLFDRHVYLLALLGMILFYGLDRLALMARRWNKGGPLGSDSGVFWIHLMFYALFNLMIGYLLTRREFPNPSGLFYYFAAMALYLAVNDYGLRRHFHEVHKRFGRYLLAGAVILGWAAGVVTPVHEAFVTALFAFLAGGTIMNVMKEELPDESAGKFAGFLIGAAAYAALLLRA